VNCALPFDGTLKKEKNLWDQCLVRRGCIYEKRDAHALDLTGGDEN